MPKISVIVPVYNVEKYLPKCLDSIVNQTLKDIEIICVNDGSPDNSLAIMKEYAKKDKRIKLIDQKNAGLGAARNVAIRQAKGTYLYFADSDDWLDETCLEKLYKRILECRADLCIYGMHHYDEQKDTILPNEYYDTSCYGENVNKICTYKDLTSVIFRRFGAFFKLYRTKWFRDNNLYFAEKVHFEDVVTHVKGMILAKRICFVNENLYFYRVNRLGSIMNANKSVIHTQDVHRFIKDSYKFIKQKKLLPLMEHEFAKFMFEQILYHYNRVTDTDVRKQFAADSKKFIDTDFADIIAKYADIRLMYNRLLVAAGVSLPENRIQKNRKSRKKYSLLGFIPLLSIEEE